MCFKKCFICEEFENNFEPHDLDDEDSDQDSNQDSDYDYENDQDGFERIDGNVYDELIRGGLNEDHDNDEYEDEDENDNDEYEDEDENDNDNYENDENKS
jgi:hypothetical protein